MEFCSTPIIGRPEARLLATSHDTTRAEAVANTFCTDLIPSDYRMDIVCGHVDLEFDQIAPVQESGRMSVSVERARRQPHRPTTAAA